MENQVNKKEKKIIPVVISIIFFVQLTLNIVLLVDNYSKQQKIAKYQDIAVSTQNINKTDQLQNEISNIKAEIKQNKIDTKLNRISNILSIGTVVTDKLTIDMFITKTDTLAYIGIKPQPSYEQYFTSQGKINLPDREIRGMLQQTISEAKRIYEKETDGLDYMPKFDNYTYTIVHHGYEIGKYENGEVKLLGE